MAITEAASKYQIPEGRVFEYGTAGVSTRLSSLLSIDLSRFFVAIELI